MVAPAAVPTVIIVDTQDESPMAVDAEDLHGREGNMGAEHGTQVCLFYSWDFFSGSISYGKPCVWPPLFFSSSCPVVRTFSQNMILHWTGLPWNKIWIRPRRERRSAWTAMMTPGHRFGFILVVVPEKAELLNFPKMRFTKIRVIVSSSAKFQQVEYLWICSKVLSGNDIV